MNPEIVYKSIERKEISKSIELDGLISILYDAKLPMNLWGSKNTGTKTINNLLDEIKNGESKLFLNQSGEIERHVNIALIDVIHIADQFVVYGLVERNQTLKNGKSINRELPTTLVTKMVEGDLPDVAAKQSLFEYLKVTPEQIDEFFEFKTRVDKMRSKSYPGLQTHYHTQPFMASINSTMFNPDGYEYNYDNKTNYYSWDMVS